MSRNRGSNTSPEVRLQKACFALGLRYRKQPQLKGRPDFAFIGKRVAVFVDGCFWHGCPLHYKKPVNRAEFWAEKIRRNQARDSAVTEALMDEGWTVLRFWEHEIKEDVEAAAKRIAATLRRLV